MKPAWKLLAGSFLMSAVLFGQNGPETAKPVCDSSHAGMVWGLPETAGSSKTESAPVPHLEVCSRKVYRYRWQVLTVSYQDLVAAAKKKPDHAGK